MLIRKAPDIRSSEITDESTYLNRRQFLGVAGTVGAAAAGGALASLGPLSTLEAATGRGSSQEEALTPYEDVTTYNNFYEFGTGKDDPHRNARNFRTRPWTLRIDGLVKKPADYHLEDFLEPHKAEERVYRLRCVEAWSMVIPWLGIPLHQVINRAEPLPGARYVEFTTLFDPARMPGQRSPVIPWPYAEGLRLDEAMHPLSLLVTGLYGKELPNQNGAPLRLIVPWKYGFKSIKSIVRMRFTETQPKTAWNEAQPNEYGFFANVNPTVDHPRWSQASERRLGEFRRRETLMFNGYADQVAHLYSGMDLRKHF